MAVASGCQASNQDVEGRMPLSNHSYSCPRSPSPHPIYSLMVEPTCSRHSLSVLLHASCGTSSHGHCVRSWQQRALVLGWIGVSQAVTNGVGGVLLPARPSRAILPAGARPGWHVRPNGITPQPVNLTASATTANHVQPLNAISFPGLTITKASLVVMSTHAFGTFIVELPILEGTSLAFVDKLRKHCRCTFMASSGQSCAACISPRIRRPAHLLEDPFTCINI